METIDSNIKVLKQLTNINTSAYNTIKQTVTLSKTGIPCLYEFGGAYSHKSSAQIVTDSHGNKKTPLYIFKHGDLCNKNHAVIPIYPGDLVFIAEGNREATSVLVYRVKSIDINTLTATLELTDFNDNIMPFLAVACKAFTYHCRQACYVKTENENENNQE